MKVRLIDAEALIQKAVSPQLTIFGNETEVVNIKDVINAPTIDPVKHGHWIEERVDFPFGEMVQYRCSICGNCERMNTVIRGDYCWACGARMDDDKDGQE